jgi:hypothetical protein
MIKCYHHFYNTSFYWILCETIISATGTTKIALESTQKNVFVTENQNSKEIIFALPFRNGR